jgi:DNA-binding MarR family transcriptional regulator
MTKDLATARALLAVMPLIGRLMTTKAREQGTVSPERAKALGRLSSGPMRSGELAHVCMLTPPAVTELVEALSREGLVRREDDPSDRRAVRVSITAAGRREVERYQAAVADAIGEALARLDPAARERIRLALEDMRRALEEVTYQPELKEQREMSHVR